MVRLSRKESRALTREKVLNAAQEAFAARGYDATTVEEIAEAAGYSIGAVYSNFSSKAQLLSAVVARRDEASGAEIARLLIESGSLAEAARAVGEHEAARADDDARWLLLAWECRIQTLRQAGLTGLVPRGSSQLTRIVGELVAAQLKRNRLDPKLSPSELAVVLTALINGLAQHRLQFPDDVPDHLYPAALELVVQGLQVGRPT